MCAKKEKKTMCPAYVSKHNSKLGRQIILWVISNEKKWHYLAVKELLALWRGITSKHHGDFYCLTCLHSFPTEKNMNRITNICKNKDFCNAVMASKDKKLLQFNNYQKSDKAPFASYVDLKCIIEKIDVCKNNPEYSSTTSSFRSIEN